LKNLFCIAVVAFAACSAPAIDQKYIDQLATEKAKAMVLQQQLDAANARLQPGEEGSKCKPDGSCFAGNTCDADVDICRPNTVISPEGSACATSLDCEFGLECRVNVNGDTCQRPKSATQRSTLGKVGDACDGDTDCTDGNKCDIRAAKCYYPIGHLIIESLDETGSAKKKTKQPTDLPATHQQNLDIINGL
jgi:hypothetical protein